MKSPRDHGLLQDVTSLHNSISQNMPKKYGMPLPIFFMVNQFSKYFLQKISLKYHTYKEKKISWQQGLKDNVKHYLYGILFQIRFEHNI